MHFSLGLLGDMGRDRCTVGRPNRCGGKRPSCLCSWPQPSCEFWALRQPSWLVLVVASVVALRLWLRWGRRCVAVVVAVAEAVACC